MTEFSRLLIEESPLLVLPKLTAILDINKAIILQQVQYWISASKHEIDGHRWIYNSYTEWAKQFPWLRARTVQYHILGLEKMGFLVSGEFNADNRDNTKWYRIDYAAVDNALVSLANSGGATDLQPPSSTLTSHHATDYQPLPETTSENTSETTVVVDERPEEFKFYEQNMGMLTPVIVDNLKEAIDYYPDGWIADAIKVAVEANARSWRYVEKVLTNWEARGKDMVLPRRNGKGAPASPVATSQDKAKFTDGKYGHVANRALERLIIRGDSGPALTMAIRRGEVPGDILARTPEEREAWVNGTVAVPERTP